jgi:hypothetical protein
MTVPNISDDDDAMSIDTSSSRSSDIDLEAYYEPEILVSAPDRPPVDYSLQNITVWNFEHLVRILPDTDSILNGEDWFQRAYDHNCYVRFQRIPAGDGLGLHLDVYDDGDVICFDIDERARVAITAQLRALDLHPGQYCASYVFRRRLTAQPYPQVLVTISRDSHFAIVVIFDCAANESLMIANPSDHPTRAVAPPIRITGVGSEPLLIDKVGNLPPFGSVMYGGNRNIMSQFQLKAAGWSVSYSNSKDRYYIKKGDTVLEFRLNPRTRMYEICLSRIVSLIEPVAAVLQSEITWTPKRNEQAARGRNLHEKLSHPNDAVLK